MLLAVLEKRCGFRLGAKDVFLNLAGGIRVEDPAIDLAVICAILSSNEDIAITPKICFAAEVGLSGEIRPVARASNNGSAKPKLGFEQIIISKYNKKGLDPPASKASAFMPYRKWKRSFRCSSVESTVRDHHRQIHTFPSNSTRNRYRPEGHEPVSIR